LNEPADDVSDVISTRAKSVFGVLCHGITVRLTSAPIGAANLAIMAIS
jgi:hypothetical protein